MIYGILVVSAVIFLCILANKFSDKFGMPTLILFMFIGMLFGSDGIVKIPFDNYELAERVCSIALIFIMFYGPFWATLWRTFSMPSKSIMSRHASAASALAGAKNPS